MASFTVCNSLRLTNATKANANKNFLFGGRVSGCFYTVADKADGPLVIVEGYGTGATVYEATGFATIAAINAGNLLAVTKAIRAKLAVPRFADLSSKPTDF